MATLPVWALGRHVSTISVQPLSINSSGVLSNSGSAETLVGQIDELSYQGRVQTETINTLTAKVENEVPVEQVDFVTMTEILPPDDSSAVAGAYGVLPKVWALGGTDVAGAVQYVLVTVTRFLQGTANTWAFTALIQDYVETVRHGKNVGRMTVQMVDPSAANPAYS